MPSHHTKSKVACSSAQAYRQRFGVRAIFFCFFSYEKEKKAIFRYNRAIFTNTVSNL